MRLPTVTAWRGYIDRFLGVSDTPHDALKHRKTDRHLMAPSCDQSMRRLSHTPWPKQLRFDLHWLLAGVVEGKNSLYQKPSYMKSRPPAKPNLPMCCVKRLRKPDASRRVHSSSWPAPYLFPRANEKFLLHGPSAENAEGIVDEGFDHRSRSRACTATFAMRWASPLRPWVYRTCCTFSRRLVAIAGTKLQ